MNRGGRQRRLAHLPAAIGAGQAEVVGLHWHAARPHRPDRTPGPLALVPPRAIRTRGDAAMARALAKLRSKRGVHTTRRGPLVLSKIPDARHF